MLLNIQSVVSKKETFLEHIDYYNPDIILGCETWLNDSILNNEILPPSYRLYRNDRIDGYGGVMIGVKSNLDSQLLDIQLNLEICIVSVHLTDGKQLILICAYRPPSSDLTYFNDLCDMITETAGKYPNAIICCAGDFNVPDIDWNNESIVGYRYPHCVNTRVLSMMHDCGFAQLVNSPTRNNNILDLFFTNKPSFIQQCYVVPGISDHESVMVTIESAISYAPSNRYKVYLWKEANISEMRNEMLNFADEYCHQHNAETPVENLWVRLKDKLFNLLDNFVPFKTVQNNCRHPWINHNIKKLRRQKQSSYNHAKATKLDFHWKRYKELKKTMQRECRKAYRNYMFRTICDPYQAGKKKKLFRHIKSLRLDHCGVGTLCKDGICVVDSQAKADLLNNQFSSIFTIDDGSPLPNMGMYQYPDAPSIDFATSGIAKLLSELDPSKSSGPDRIPSMLLKMLATEISTCLKLLFSASLLQGNVPSDWRRALVSPLFKKGDRKDPSNYRPVSLTCVCSKVMEHIILTNIMSHLETHGILSDAQFGFRKRRSAEL